jgi:hypothetical protein
MGTRFTTLPLAALALALAALTLAACAGPSGATPTPLPAGAPAPTPGAYWRTDLPVGAREGERAPDALALTLEGQVTSIEQLAGGRPILVYFFASW